MLNADQSSEMARLKELLSQAAQLAAALDGGFSHGAKPAATSNDLVSIADDESVLAFAKNLYAFRRRRNEFFSGLLFADPAWDILLELYIMRVANKPVRVKNACLASGVPATTALRWIGLLEEQGLLTRSADTSDQRVRWVSLTDHAFRTMHQLLSGQVRQATTEPDAEFDTRASRTKVGVS
ncbi:MAG: hypothetical protein Q8R81_01930 [Novosphingobium sp.]|uniref:hypothetical protein n=1 Tax=Novosphingobium sp. TaxID=1874826 RepID=UPI0027359D90|nr:hypothetical protein [Novosphingobium sp.]MDP3549137.1 hypothetical protein [Novosphingobium sp.]